MMVLNVKGKEYKVKFGYNSFCDTDLMDRTSALLKIFQGEEIDEDKDVAGINKIKDLFCCVRDLLFVGFKKHNPVETVQDIGDILDDYKEEATDEDKRSLVSLFTGLTEELMNEGFLSDLMKEAGEQANARATAIPQDHKRSKKNVATQK